MTIVPDPANRVSIPSTTRTAREVFCFSFQEMERGYAADERRSGMSLSDVVSATSSSRFEANRTSNAPSGESGGSSNGSPPQQSGPSGSDLPVSVLAPL